MLLAGLLHASQLFFVKLWAINVSPIVGGGIHGETGSHRAVGADNDVVLASPTIPFGKMQLTIGILHKAGRSSELLGDIAVGPGPIAVPPEVFEVTSTGHANERFDLLQTLHRIDHLISSFVLFNEPIHKGIDFRPIFGPDVGGI